MLELQKYVKSDYETSQSHLKAYYLRKCHSNTSQNPKIMTFVYLLKYSMVELQNYE